MEMTVKESSCLMLRALGWKVGDTLEVMREAKPLEVNQGCGARPVVSTSLTIKEIDKNGDINLGHSCWYPWFACRRIAIATKEVDLHIDGEWVELSESNERDILESYGKKPELVDAKQFLDAKCITQDAFIKAHDLKIGSSVKVMYEPEKPLNRFLIEMKKSVGKTLEINAIFSNCMKLSDNWHYDWPCLNPLVPQPVKQKESEVSVKDMSVGDVITVLRWRNVTDKSYADSRMSVLVAKDRFVVVKHPSYLRPIVLDAQEVVFGMVEKNVLDDCPKKDKILRNIKEYMNNADEVKYDIERGIKTEHGMGWTTMEPSRGYTISVHINGGSNR